MSFVSITFVIFYVLVLAFRFTFGSDKLSTVYLYTLLVFSLLFYGWHAPAYLALLLACIASNYTAGWLLAAADEGNTWQRRFILLAALGLNLGIHTGVFQVCGVSLPAGCRRQRSSR